MTRSSAATMKEKIRTPRLNVQFFGDGIYFELTSPGIPQKNGMSEQGFYILYFWMNAIMVHAGL